MPLTDLLGADVVDRCGQPADRVHDIRLVPDGPLIGDYDKAFQVIVAGTPHTFDSFEYAIHAVAPTCDRCGCRIIGHGVEADGRIFCCANCAKQEGNDRLVDRT